jgi:glutamyl/glutaminyl-tRNA synthetase
VAVADWRKAGYLPEALLSYLALLGFHPGDDREILSRSEMLEAFSLERVGRSGSVFDPDKLRWVNATLLRHAGGHELRGWAVGFLPPEARSLPPGELEACLEAVRGNLGTLADLSTELAPLVQDALEFEAGAQAALADTIARRLCAELAVELGGLAEWNEEGIKSAIQRLGRRLGLGGRDLFQPVRAALTGRTHGPELPRFARLLGRSRCLARLEGVASMP